MEIESVKPGTTKRAFSIGITLPPLPAYGLAPELRDYLNQLNEFIEVLDQRLNQLRIQQLGGPDGSLSRRQAMEFMGIKSSKFSQIRGQLEQAPSAGYPRYTLASCRQWMQDRRPRAMSKSEVEQMVEYRLNNLLESKRTK